MSAIAVFSFAMVSDDSTPWDGMAVRSLWNEKNPAGPLAIIQCQYFNRSIDKNNTIRALRRNSIRLR